MKELRWRIAAAFAWLLFFFNIERFHEPINIASFVYVYAAAIAMLAVLCPAALRIPALRLLAVASIGLLVIKWQLGYAITGAAAPLTVTEICAVAVSLAIGRTIARAIMQFETGAAEVLNLHPAHGIPRFDESQSEFWREVRRAREFERPLSLLAMRLDTEEASIDMHRFLEEMQRKSVDKYLASRVVEQLQQETRDSDLVAAADDYLVVMLPEATEEQAEQWSRRLEQTVQQKLGVKLQCGRAAFPSQEVTLSGLLQRAVDAMRQTAPTSSTSPHPILTANPPETEHAAALSADDLKLA